jgi:signal transduction histidine kinase
MSPVTLEELRTVYVLQDLPDEHLQWLLDHSRYYEMEDGECLMKTGEPIDEMMLIVEGKLSFFMDVHGSLIHYYTFENDKSTGGAGGLLPYSRLKTSPGYSYAVGKLRSIRLHKDHFHELEQLNPDLIQKLIGYMTERARTFATIQLQHEKVNALGKLAAGIAHELNNPAAAINRISSELTKRVKLNYEFTEKLLASGIDPAHIKKISALVESKEKEDKKKLTSMQQIEIEDEINDWFEKKNFPECKKTVDAFSDARFTCDDLEEIHKLTGDAFFTGMISWLENLLTSRRIISDLGEASQRISNLVGAIKSHVHMDRTNDMQLTNVNRDIENTLTLLGYKLREKNIEVTKKFAEDLPEVPAYVGELNQVWTNIIDNAIYAIPQGGQLIIETCKEPKDVKVKITDNGPGIPKEIQSRIFDPFFTTKKVGEGTGIGLDIVSRIMKRHNGEIKLNSEPGKTEFSICVPLKANAN